MRPTFALGLLALLMIPASAIADFELRIDPTVNGSNGQYSVDVLLRLNGDTSINLFGLIATVQTQQAGVTFTGISQPSNPLFSTANAMDYFGQQFMGDPKTLIASVFPTTPSVAADKIAFKLNFEVAPETTFPFDIVFLNTTDPLLTFYSKQEFIRGQFTTLTSATITGVPEPSTVGLFLVAVAVPIIRRHRRRGRRLPSVRPT